MTKRHRYISYFFIAVIKCHNQDTYKESVRWGFQFQGIRLQSDRAKAWHQGQLRARIFNQKQVVERASEVVWGSWNPRLPSSDTHPPIRPHLLIFSKQEPTIDQMFRCPRIMGDISSKRTQPLLIIVPKDSMLYKRIHDHSCLFVLDAQKPGNETSRGVY